MPLNFIFLIHLSIKMKNFRFYNLNSISLKVWMGIEIVFTFKLSSDCSWNFLALSFVKSWVDIAEKNFLFNGPSIFINIWKTQRRALTKFVLVHGTEMNSWCGNFGKLWRIFIHHLLINKLYPFQGRRILKGPFLLFINENVQWVKKTLNLKDSGYLIENGLPVHLVQQFVLAGEFFPSVPRLSIYCLVCWKMIGLVLWKLEP